MDYWDYAYGHFSNQPAKNGAIDYPMPVCPDQGVPVDIDHLRPKRIISIYS
jgi:hypothetical protein